MLVLISDYNTDTFNKLLSFKEAGLKFDSFDGGTFIADIMAPLFPKHRVENVLGLQLLHRHFTLQPGERLVDFNGTSVPIKPEGDPASNLTTTIWDLEQSITNLAQPFQWSNPNFQKFVSSKQSSFQEYSTEVNKHGVKGLFELNRYPRDGFLGCVEVGVRCTNTNLSPAQGAFFVTGKAREVAWYFFTEDFTKRGCKCFCPEYNGAHKGHNSHNITQSG